jgi:hypothetical protein
MFGKYRSAILTFALAAASCALVSAPTPAAAQSSVFIKGRDASGAGYRAVDVSPGGVLRGTDTASVLFGGLSAPTLTTTTNSADLANYGARGVVLVLDVTAASGTSPTLDVKVQVKDTLSGKYVDLAGAAFAQKTAANTSMLTIYPGSTVAANVSISIPLPDTWRVVATIGGTTPSFTFTLGAHYID